MKIVNLIFLAMLIAGSSLAQVERTGHAIRLNYIAEKYELHGDSVVVGIEDGRVDFDKISYRNRVNYLSTNYSEPDNKHGTHVVQKSMDSGNNTANKKRSLRGTTILSPFNAANFDNNYINDTMRLVNRSLGTENPYGKYLNGRDRHINKQESFMYFFSSGNERKNKTKANYGYYSTGRPYEIIKDDDKVWATLTGIEKHSKNSITVNSYTFGDANTGSGSCGPTYDGRIKPDITACGGATSFSAPMAAAAYAALLQNYRRKNGGQDANSAYLKALLLNTADDVGRPGPDFRNGFGKVNARRAYMAMDDDQMAEIDMQQHDTIQVDFDGSGILTIPSNLQAGNNPWAEIKIMVYWHDKAALTYNVTSPPNNAYFKALVNDVNMQASITRPSGTTLYNPLVLDHRYLDSTSNFIINDAQQGIDTLNNVEQIVIKNPKPGNTISVQLQGINIQGTQNCVVVYDLVPRELVLTHPIEVRGGEIFKQGEQEYIRWDANGIQGLDKFKLRYRVLGTTGWETFKTLSDSDKRVYLWTVPTGIANFTQLEIKVDALDASGAILKSSRSGVLTIARQVKDLEICWIGWESGQRRAGLAWTGLNGAVSYNVYRLSIDGKYMEKYLENIPITSIEIDSLLVGSSQDPGRKDWNEWLAVTPVDANNIEGELSNAIEVPRGFYNYDYGIAQGATLVSTRSAVLNAKLFPRDGARIHSARFQVAKTGTSSLNFVDEGPVYTAGGAGFLASTSLSFSWNDIWSPELNLDQEYVYRLKLVMDYDNDLQVDAVIYSNLMPVQVPAGAAPEMAGSTIITMQAVEGISGRNSRTIEFWAKPTSLTDGSLIRIGERDDTGNTRDAFIFKMTGVANQWQWIINDEQEHIFDVDVPYLDEMHHYALVYNKDEERLYLAIDGMSIPASVIEDVVLKTDNEEIKIGGNYVGLIDELRIWSTARTLDEIREHMHYSIADPIDMGVPTGFPSTLLRYVQFDDESERPLEAVQLKNLTSRNLTSFTDSPFALGDPRHGTNQILNKGWNHFPDQSTWVTTQDPLYFPDGEIAVSRLHTKPFNGPELSQSNVSGIPAGMIIDKVFDRDYRAIQDYTALDPLLHYNLRFLLPLTQADLAQPANIKLLSRASSSADNWEVISDSYRIEYYAGPNTYHVYFDNLFAFEQFIAVRVAPDPNQASANLLQQQNELLADKSQSVKIYPNPIMKGDQLIIRCADLTSALDLRIYDRLGRLIHASPLNKALNYIDLPGLTSGLYICEVLLNDRVIEKQRIVITE